METMWYIMKTMTILAPIWNDNDNVGNIDSNCVGDLNNGDRALAAADR